MSGDHAAGLDTFPKLLAANARIRGGKPASREKDYGIWQTWTWSEVADEVRALACGLAALGFKRGDRLAIIGDNRPHLYWSMPAAQAVGGVPVPIYQDSVADEMQYVLAHAECRFAVVENQEQVDKLLEIKDRLPLLETIIYHFPRGMRHYTQDFLHLYADVQDKGRAFDAANAGFYDGEVAKGAGGDLAIMVYTSGTTGRPKGVMLSADNLIQTARNAADWEGLTDDDEMLAYLPMAWVGDHIFSVAQAFTHGFCVACPESAETVLQDLREIGPTYFFAPPRIFENILTTVMIRIEDAAPWKQRMFHYFMDLAGRVGRDILDGKPVPFADRVKYRLGEFLVYGPLKNVLGLTRMRLGYTAGEAIGPDIFDFYRSLGLNLKQLYGSTEASVFITIQPNGDIRSDSVGVPAPGVDIRIADTGEVLFKSPGVFHAYYKDDDATAETKTADGWVHTGDAGFLDADGHLKIIDRAKDVGRLTDGTLFAPKYLENKLKFFPFVSEAVTFGDGRDYVAAFINMDLEAVGNWAERRGLAYTGYTDLAGRPEVLELVADCVDKVNADLAQDDKLAGSQIKRFLILHKELDADDGELTRTRKVRRSVITERYGDLIAALYSDQDHCEVTATVTFEDGRTDTIHADLKIRDAKVIPPGAAQAAA
ncbi:MAG TPA: long-chain fatty acid--CoA ligase [Rhodospirillaceae bacterium]|nr:long-chain fatty acid--CoA ligase [Magnetovibrio sp.]HBT41246.1 long-chain fatty acid--CoA ligase [Rhodospirillaceae bacterium]HCS69413.1 long-chain fatty acid--CoA ligase [Rhodospirillaceae bacterium]|tara:strand:- start:5986 stop:7947 length:1962 start_codon:yes stop_codon:yes gene_type:complete